MVSHRFDRMDVIDSEHKTTHRIHIQIAYLVCGQSGTRVLSASNKARGRLATKIHSRPEKKAVSCE